MTAYEKGRAAARKWIDTGNHKEPANPYERRTADHRRWSAGYGDEMYVEFGDPSRDMERQERAFGC